MPRKEKAIWASSTWDDSWQPPVYFNSIPIILPVGAVLEITRRRNEREKTTTEVVTVRMPKREVANAP